MCLDAPEDEECYFEHPEIALSALIVPSEDHVQGILAGRIRNHVPDETSKYKSGKFATSNFMDQIPELRIDVLFDCVIPIEVESQAGRPCDGRNKSRPAEEIEDERNKWFDRSPTTQKEEQRGNVPEEGKKEL